MLSLLAAASAEAPADAGAVAWKTLFSQAALVIAVIGFLAVVVGLMLKRNQKTYERARRLPLEED